MSLTDNAWQKNAGQAKEPTVNQTSPDKDVRAFLKETGQDTLPQSGILVNVLDHLVDNQHIAEAYLRGSFSYGAADKYSDIDLFTVVEPEKLRNTFDSIVEYLEEHYPISILCHDNRVVDYGGIGFMFICQRPTGESFQLDVYMAMRGVPPKVPLVGARVYGQDGYKWADDYRVDNRSLPADTQDFIKEFEDNSNLDEKVLHVFDELMITLYMMSKHIKRGQLARTIDDHQAAFASSVDLIKLATGESTHHSAYYFADKMIAKYKDSANSHLKKACELLENVIDSPNNQNKINTYVEISETVVRGIFPEIAKRSEQKMLKIRNLLCSYGEDGGTTPENCSLVQKVG